MTDTAHRPSVAARARRLLLVLLGVTVVLGPIPVGLVWAWTVHPLLVVPAYLLGIAAWLTLLSGAWALVRRVFPQRDVRSDAGKQGPASDPTPATVMPEVHSTVRMPSPRAGATAPQRVS